MKTSASTSPDPRLRRSLESIVDLFGVVLAGLTPWLRRLRTRWGLSAREARRAYPGDAFIPDPSWQWTHALTINAPPQEVWASLLQLGQEGGALRYHALQRLIARVPVEAAPEWPELGGSIRLHPQQAPLPIVAAQPRHWLLAHTSLSLGQEGNETPRQRPSASWLFLIEPLSLGRSRLISRYRIKHHHSLAARLRFGAARLEPIAFIVDRRLLREIRRHAEHPRPWRSSSLGHPRPGV